MNMEKPGREMKKQIDFIIINKTNSNAVLDGKILSWALSTLTGT